MLELRDVSFAVSDMASDGVDVLLGLAIYLKQVNSIQ